MNEKTIFVSIASFRDKICTKTLSNLYQQAEFPNRVFVGVCQQNNASDIDCVTEAQVPEHLRGNVKVMRLDSRDAKGPTFARWLCTTLWEGQDFFFQIDSHTLFVRHWDSKLVSMYYNIIQLGLSQKPILSHYPKDYEDFKKDADGKSSSTTHMCKAFFNDQRMISFEGAQIMDVTDVPRRHAFIAAGMFFVHSDFLKECPYDPELPNLFVGEEIAQSARAYTFRYDVFNPNQDICFHFYTRSDEPKFWNDNHFDDADSTAKIKYLLNLEDVNLADHLKHNAARFGMGQERSLDDFWRFIGADFETLKVNRNFCEEDANETHFPPDGMDWKSPMKSAKSIFKNNKILIFLLVLIGLIVLSAFFTKHRQTPADWDASMRSSQ